MLKFIIAFLFICLLAGCDENSTVSTENNPLVKAYLINHTENKFIKDDTTLVEQKDLDLIKGDFSNLKETKQFNMKATFGFYDLALFYKNGQEADYSIAYTRYDGVIIYNYKTNRGYKNDAIDGTVLRLLSKN